MTIILFFYLKFYNTITSSRNNENDDYIIIIMMSHQYTVHFWLKLCKSVKVYCLVTKHYKNLLIIINMYNAE